MTEAIGLQHACQREYYKPSWFLYSKDRKDIEIAHKCLFEHNLWTSCCTSVRPFVTLFLFSPKWTYGALKPYTTVSNKTNKTNTTNKTNKTDKTKECTYPSQLPVSHEWLVYGVLISTWMWVHLVVGYYLWVGG